MFEINSKLIIVKFLKLIKYRVNLDSVNFMISYFVIVADNMFTGRKRNVEHWIGHPNFDLLNHDIVNPLYIEVSEVFFQSYILKEKLLGKIFSRL